MDKDKIYEYLAGIDHLTQDIRDEMAKPDIPPVTVIPAGAELQEYLDKGGRMKCETGAQFAYSAGYKLTKPTSLEGDDTNLIMAAMAPAMRVPVGATGFVVRGLTFKTGLEVALLLGMNDTTQTTLEQVPNDIMLEDVHIDSHRGKRGIEVNSRATTLKDCEVQDLYDPEKQDSQAVAILNTPGDVEIIGGYYEAASETIMVGGDKMKIPGVHPQNIIIEGVKITKNLGWKGNAATPVKNLLELKDGWGVVIRRCELWNCWLSGQQGEAFMFTPKSGGQVDVTVEDCKVWDVSRVVNITGMDITGNTVRTKVTFLGGDYRTNRTAFGGDGRFCLITGGPESVVFRGIFARGEGSSFVAIEDKKTVDNLEIVDSDFNYGTYGIRIGGLNHGDNSLGIVKNIRIENNRITGAASAFKTRYPNNTWL